MDNQLSVHTTSNNTTTRTQQQRRGPGVRGGDTARGRPGRRLDIYKELLITGDSGVGDPSDAEFAPLRTTLGSSSSPDSVYGTWVPVGTSEEKCRISGTWAAASIIMVPINAKDPGREACHPSIIIPPLAGSNLPTTIHRHQSVARRQYNSTPIAIDV